jgi:uncharacterized membrane protein YfcA
VETLRRFSFPTSDRRNLLTPSAYLLLAIIGLAAGFVDAIAGGGGLLTVPALLWAGLPPQIALGTNKFQSSCGTALAAANYARAGLLNWSELRLGIAVTGLASVVGALVVTRLDADFLRHIIPILLLVIAGYFWWKPELGTERRLPRIKTATFAWLFGMVLGFYDGFFGPGTGSFWMVGCVLLLGLDLGAATGHTKAMNLASNLGSLAVFLAAGQVRFDVGAAMIAGQLIGAKLGSGLVIRRGARLVRPVFLAVVFVLAGRLLWLAARG